MRHTLYRSVSYRQRGTFVFVAIFYLVTSALAIAFIPQEAFAGEGGPPPTITSFTPASGKGPEFVTVYGTNLNGATQVSIDGIPSANVKVISSTELQAQIRSLATTGRITVTTVAGTATSSGIFTVTWSANEPGSPPTITSFSPTSGQFPGFVTITGTNLSGASQVTIGGVPCAEVKVISPTQVQALIRSIAYTGPITVTTMHGTAASSQTFTITKHY